MAALDATGGAVTGTPVAVTARKPAIAAPMVGGNATATDAETIAVGVHFDRLDPFQQHFVDNILESINFEYMVTLFGSFQGNAKGANTATA